MNVALDLDGTADSFPRVFQSLSSALVNAGHHVYILTGADGTAVTETDVETKKGYLNSLGFGPGTYTSLVVVPHPHPTNKAEQVQSLGIDLIIDNKQKTMKKAAATAACLLLVNSQEP